MKKIPDDLSPINKQEQIVVSNKSFCDIPSFIQISNLKKNNVKKIIDINPKGASTNA